MWQPPETDSLIWRTYVINVGPNAADVSLAGVETGNSSSPSAITEVRMDSKGIRVFHNDDQAYDEWVAQHEGYILTAPRPGEYMLHDSKCPHLGRDRVARRLTRKPRRWASQQGTLVAWTEQAIGSKPLLCQTCR
jgi:hypothetical protein